MSDSGKGCVLITRPQPAASETASLLAARGYTPVLAPMLAIQPRHWATAERTQAILVTSANALPALTRMDRTTLLLAVGDATAARARAMGFTTVESAARDAKALADLAIRRCDPERGGVVLASGTGQGMALAADLRARGLNVRRRMAYSARPVTTLPDDAMAALRAGEIIHALFFSAATAQAFLACMLNQHGLVEGIEAHAISQQTAEVLAPLPWRHIRVASHPNQDELVAHLT